MRFLLVAFEIKKKKTSQEVEILLCMFDFKIQVSNDRTGSLPLYFLLYKLLPFNRNLDVGKARSQIVDYADSQVCQNRTIFTTDEKTKIRSAFYHLK